MNSKKVILATIILVFIFLVFFTYYRMYPTLFSFIFQIRLKEKIFEVNNKSIYYYEVLEPKKIVAFIMDNRMDRKGNSYNIETNLGIHFANLMIQNQILPVFYERKDAKISPALFYSKQELTKEWLEIFQVINEFNKQKKLPLSLVLYGDGCTIFLNSLNSLKKIELIDKIFLINCGYPDSLLNYYGSLIFQTMKISKVEENVIHQAKQEWKDWYFKNNYDIYDEEKWKKEQEEYIKNKVHPDLIAFRKTIKNFQKKENIEFLKESKNIYFYDLLEILLKNSKIQIFHLISEYDEEMPEEIFNQIKDRALKYSKYNYNLQILNKTNHFLFLLDQKPESPLEVALSRNSFGKEISKEFSEIVIKNLKNH